MSSYRRGRRTVEVYRRLAPSFTTRTDFEILDPDKEVLSGFGILLINCPWLHLALKLEPPGGAPQGYSWTYLIFFFFPLESFSYKSS